MKKAAQENQAYFHQAYTDKKYPWSKDSCQIVGNYLDKVKADNPAVNSLLDIGCGEGANAALASKKGLNAFGIDQEPLAAQSAAKNNSTCENINTEFLVANALSLPFASQSFDVVLDHGCLHHIRKTDWKSYLKNVGRVLKPEGHLILEVFSREHKGYGPAPKRGWHIKQGAYRRFFDRRDIDDLLKDDFDVVCIQEKKGEVSGDWHLLARKKS